MFLSSEKQQTVLVHLFPKGGRNRSGVQSPPEAFGLFKGADAPLDPYKNLGFRRGYSLFKETKGRLQWQKRKKRVVA
jgi:hypothetical protein